jgi:adenosylhomocysteine nucleosidase
MISANQEWSAVRKFYPQYTVHPSPYGEWFEVEVETYARPIILFHGGWGKIAAAASTQYVIDRWQPRLLINLATCGGFAGEIEQGAIILAERTIVYDIIEQMTDPDQSIKHFSTELDLTWLKEPYPQAVKRTLLVSADRDLLGNEVARLKENYGAIAGDWESGAIAYVAAHNRIPCLILRGVTDLVSEQGSVAYNNIKIFEDEAEKIMMTLLTALPNWIKQCSDIL